MADPLAGELRMVSVKGHRWVAHPGDQPSSSLLHSVGSSQGDTERALRIYLAAGEPDGGHHLRRSELPSGAWIAAKGDLVNNGDVR